MKNTLSIFFSFSLIFNFTAQTISVNSNLTPAELLNNVFSGQGVTISNITINGSTVGANVPVSNFTYFSNPNPAFPFSSGVLLTTGNGFYAIGPNSSVGSFANNPPTSTISSDPHLTSLANGQLFNGLVVEFDFVPTGDTILFNYIFGSEEYPEFSPSMYNDVFGLFLWGPGISGSFPLNGFASGGINFATLPDGTQVNINNVCDEANTSYYVFNDSGLSYGSAIQYDGTTIVLNAGAGVQCGQTYHMKFAIGNVGDTGYDSGIFFKEGSFSSPGYQNTTASIDYNAPFCLPSTSQAVTLNGTGAYAGGSFSATPNGLVLDPSTGQITPNSSALGEYTVVYASPVVNSCGATTATTVQVLDDVVLPIPEICGVGLDSVTQKNRVVWEKPPYIGIDSFFVYRETTPNVYSQIGAVSYYSPAVFIDLNSNPLNAFYRYKISIKGYCGSETGMSTVAHKTVKLDVTEGTPGTWQLNWNPYEGFAYNTYTIYRGADTTSLDTLTTVSGSSTSFLDNTAPAGPMLYQIEVVNPNDCNPNKINGYGVSRSNIASNGIASVNAIASETISVYPNPTNGDFNLEVSEGYFGKSYQLVDGLGREINTGVVTKQKTLIASAKLQSGTYLLRLEGHPMVIKCIKH